VNDFTIRGGSSKTDLVEGVVNLGELFWGEVAGVDAFHLPAKVDELGWVCRGREWERGQLDGHCEWSERSKQCLHPSYLLQDDVNEHTISANKDKWITLVTCKILGLEPPSDSGEHNSATSG